MSRTGEICLFMDDSDRAQFVQLLNTFALCFDAEERNLALKRPDHNTVFKPNSSLHFDESRTYGNIVTAGYLCLPKQTADNLVELKKLKSVFVRIIDGLSVAFTNEVKVVRGEKSTPTNNVWIGPSVKIKLVAGEVRLKRGTNTAEEFCLRS